MIEITREPIQPEEVIAKVRKDANGGVVTFMGTVRDNSEGKRVLYLQYEAYPEMAKKKLAEIASEIQSRWGLKDVAITHRVGRVKIGENAVVIAIGAPHRLPAFEACEHAINRIKEIVPIWKKEFYEDGSAWVEGEHKKA